MMGNDDFILVDNTNLPSIYQSLLGKEVISLDTETYGLKYHDRAFSLMLCDGTSTYYFNFHDYEDGTFFFNRSEFIKYFEEFFSAPRTWIMHNAPFDMHRLWLEGVELKGLIWDTYNGAKIQYNQHMSYTLADCLDRIGLAKDDAVEKYISKKRLYTWETVPGKGTRNKLKHYDQVPFDIMFNYGCMDAYGTFMLYEHQYLDARELMHIESDMTRIICRMYRRGMLTDPEYIRGCWAFESQNQTNAALKIEELAGAEFQNSPKYYATMLEKQGEKVEYTEKGNPSLDKKKLAKMDSEGAKAIKEFRRAGKYIESYYSSFLHGAIDNVIHPQVKSLGAATGRFSSQNPNCQNWPKQKDATADTWETRKCFVPRPGYGFAAIDYSQQEYRLMLDYANEFKLIRQVMNGIDVHQATADMVNIDRDPAKTVNFGLLYGTGINELAKMLGVSVQEARFIRKKYFSRLRKVQRFIEDVKRIAKKRGFVKTFTGRRVYLPRWENIDFSYKMPNHLIQGGSADMVKLAMIACQKYIDENELDIHIVLTVHDEIIFEVREDLYNHIFELRDIMKNIYEPMNGCSMDCSIEWSTVSMGKQDLKEVA